MIQNEIEEQELPTHVRIRRWIGEPTGITKGWLLLSILLGWVFLGCAIFAAVRTVQLDNRVTEERIQATLEQQVTTCTNSNATRAEAMQVALSDVDEDRRIWTSIDTIIEGGIPEPSRTLIFESLVKREERINTTYVQVDCALITQENP